MELRTTRQMRRNEQTAKILAKKEAAKAPAQAKPARTHAPADKLTVSRQALAFLEEQNRRMWQQAQEREQRRQARMDDSLSALDSAKQELDLMSKQAEIMKKCQKIAASIMKGNRVPPEDLEYLMKNDPDGFKLAMAMRRENPDPEDEESVLDEEDRSAGCAEGLEGGGEVPSVEAAEPSEGGGDAAPAAE